LCNQRITSGAASSELARKLSRDIERGFIYSADERNAVTAYPNPLRVAKATVPAK
jgi:hypothetical protein